MKESRFEQVFHYIDDFVVLGPPVSAECERGLLCLQQMCENLGVLLAEYKTDGPATRLTFLGIEFDSQAIVLRLPAKKLQSLQSLLAECHTRCSGRRGELESLVGILQHTSKVVRHGRCFLRHFTTCWYRHRNSRNISKSVSQTVNARPLMVGLVQSALKWRVYPETSPGELHGHPPLVGWVGLMGMWRRLAEPVVSSGVGSPSHCFCTEGILFRL